VLKNKNLEDIINDWSTQLEDHVGTFTKQAHQVAEWDNKIIDNGAKIMKIYEHVNKVQVSQKELDQTLELIFTQQQELNGMLDSLEGELDKLMSAQGRQENPADIEREKGYQLAEDLNRQLDQMGVTLRELIKKINSNQQQSADDDNPIYQIVQILNAHLNSLQWIDQSSSALQHKIAEVDKQLKASKLEHDKLSRMRKNST
jgi:nuclear pore complex protein Nup62